MEQNIISDNATRVREPLVAELQDLKRQIEAVSEDAQGLLAGLSEAQVNWRLTDAHWSIAECLDHLTVTNREIIKQMETAISDARSKGLTGRGPFRHGIIGNMLVRSLEPPAKLKFKAPKIFKPRPNQSLEVVAREFFAVQDELRRLITEANGINLARVKINSPVTKLIRLSLGQAFGLIATHARRHLWQARQVRENPAFPAMNAAS